MILTGPEIHRRLGKDIIISPYEPDLLNPNSYNLRLSDEIMVYTELPLDMKKNNPVERLKIPAEGLLLEPGKLYLGRTVEHTETRNLVPMLEGRSSIGRLGLYVHVTAGFGDVGFSGFWTLELHCVQPIRIYAGVQICQIFYHAVDGEIVEYKSGKYQGNRGVQSSRLWMDFVKDGEKKKNHMKKKSSSKTSSPTYKLPLDSLWTLLDKIPAGRVSTYKAVAEKLKLSNPRNVGWMLKQNKHAPVIPCHRVIQSSGRIGGYNGYSAGAEVAKKLQLLKKEGVRFSEQGKITDSAQILRKL